MKVSAPTRTSAQARQRSAFKLSPVAAGCAVLLFGMTDLAMAQEATNMETVTVSGIRKGIEAAISIKKNADSIVEAISAEDIGKLPDASVAESISRLPGVTAQRNKSSGKAQSISVRGMSPDFNGALLNGREQASTGDSRGVEFDQFPSELLGGVVIYKTPDAALVGQGLASTIDLRTVRPLDFSSRAVAVNKRRQRSGVDSGAEEGSGNRTSLSYIDQFADRTIGIALGFARYDETGAEQQKFNSWGGWAADVDYNGGKVKAPGGFTADTEQSSAKRDGAMAVLQFRPNKSFESTIDMFRSSGTFALKKTGLEGAIGGQSAGNYDPSGMLTNATIANGVATAGTITNYKGVVRNHVESGDDTLKSWGWNNKLKLEGWTTTLDLANSKVKRDSARYETTAGQPGDATKSAALAAALGTISWTGFNGSNFTDVKYKTSLNYSDRAVAKLTDVMGWSGGAASPQAGYVALPSVSDEVKNIRLAARRDVEFGPINATEFGINFADREKIRTTKEGRLVITGSDPYGATTVPGAAVNVAGTTGLPVVSWDPRGSLGSIYSLAAKVDADILNKDWSVTEKVTTAYIKNDIDGMLMGLPYRGNFGTQIVRTEQGSTGFNVDRAQCTGNTAATCPGATVAAGKTYTDILPSLNGSLNLGNDQVVRLGLAKTQARPNMGDMRASVGFSVDTTSGKPILKGDGGNPELEPFRATALDLSYEKYFGIKGYISAAAFYKKLDTYILRTGRAFNFTPYITKNTVLPVGGSVQGLMTTPFNGNGGNISGIELAVNLPFSMLHKTLDGFGMFVNHSSTSSTVSLPPSGFSTENVGSSNIPLPGLSKQVTNMRAYYEKHGVQVALARRTRSDFLGEISDFQDNRQLTYVKGESIVDLQISYEFQSGWFKGLSLLAQANNLTNAEFQRYTGDSANITEKVKYGKTYLFGANYKF